MTREQLETLAEKLAAEATGDGDVQQILTSVPREDFNTFYGLAHKALDRAAAASRPEWAPAKIGARHPLASPLVRRRAELLELEWRSRNG